MIPLSDDNTTRHAPVASRTILVMCCVVFIWQLSAGPWAPIAARALGFTPEFFFAGGPDDPRLAWTPFAVPLVTYMFLHGSWLHLIGNMLFLWIFGDNVEDRVGHGRFVAFYLMCGFAAAVAQTVLNRSSLIPMVGASGAIAGVMGAYLVLYPRAQVTVLVPVFIVVELVRLPAWILLLFWFAVQVLYEFAPAELGGGIAFRSHIGGFLAGMVMAPLFLKISGRSRADLSNDNRRLVR